MRRIDRNTSSGTAASRRSHTGAAQILRPKSPAPHISGKHLLVQLADIATGLPTIINAARQVHRGGGGRTQLALAAGTPLGVMGKPKFPDWMGHGMVVGRREKTGIHSLDRAPGIQATNFIADLAERGGVTAFDKAHPRLSPSYPIAKERRLLGYGPPGGSFLDHLARLNDPEAGKAFVQWMMLHHYKNPN